MSMIVPVILAGGAGTRLWPVSRETMPKHLAPLIGEESLLQLTAKRLLAHAPAKRLITVAAEAQDPLIREQYQKIDPDLGENRLLEPVGRNTAAAIALAALHAEKTFGGDALLWVCPSDHLVRDEAALKAALEAAAPVAAEGDLLTFGIDPTRPETGYGYIKGGEAKAVGPVRAVARFVEKPAHDVAEAMLIEGGYYWNSGMFLYRADRILEELAEHAPAILKQTREAFEAAGVTENGAILTPRQRYETIPSAPIDKAVMEKSRRIAVVPCNPGWTDLGSWHSIWDESEKDAHGNAIKGDVLLEGAENCLVFSTSRLVTVAKVKDLAIIETKDAILITDRNQSEPVKAIVGTLNKSGRKETR